MKAPAEHGRIQARRRAIVHTVIAGFHGGQTNSAQCVVEALAKRGDWPEATWARARKGPPDYQQCMNYMHSLRGEGKLEYCGGYWRSIVRPEPLDRLMRKRAAEALQLRSEGKDAAAIAEHLGIGRSLASGLLADPYGEKERERKRMYCPVCGAKKGGSVDWCRKCKTGKIEDLLPPLDFMRYVHRARERGLEVVFGVDPDCVRVIRIGTGRGIVEHRLPSNQSWDEAVELLELA